MTDINDEMKKAGFVYRTPIDKNHPKKFQCPKEAFINLLDEFSGFFPPEYMTDVDIEDFVERFLKNNFQDYNHGHE